MGGSSVLNVAIGMVRTKFVAVLLGPSGVGLLGMYSQIINLVSTFTSIGVGGSGTRKVASAFGTGDDREISKAVLTLRRTTWLTGSAGMLVMIIFCIPLSKFSFNTVDYSLSLALLSVPLLFGTIASGQSCVLVGIRRISDIAKMSIIGTISGTIISIPCFYFWGERGIVVSLILSAAATLITSWWFVRRLSLLKIKFSWNESRLEAKKLLTLGSAFMGAGLANAVSQYLIRILLLRQFTIDAVGIYQSAFNLSIVFAGFVLDAMATDYFPRLCAVANDNIKVKQMVNEQTEISILLTLPGLIAMMIFAPLVVQLFYTKSFSTAVPILRLCTIGILIRVSSWPLGVVLRAKGEGGLIFFTELLQATMHIVALYVCIWIWGFNGTGIAFIIVTFFYIVIILFIVHRLVGTVWNRDVFLLVSVSVIIMVILLINSSINPNIIGLWGINLLILSSVCLFSLKQLSRKSGFGLNVLARFKIW